MECYKPLNEIIGNEDVIHILNSAKLLGEGDLLVEQVKKDEDNEIYKIYVPPKDYNFTLRIHRDGRTQSSLNSPKKVEKIRDSP